MSNETGKGFETFGRKVDETFNQAAPRVEEELKKVIAYLNDEVVPGIRDNSSKAIRLAAEQLSRLAERIDRHTEK